MRRDDGVQRATRTGLPIDELEPRGLAVIVASLVREVEAAPPVEPPERAPSPRDDEAEAHPAAAPAVTPAADTPAAAIAAAPDVELAPATTEGLDLVLTAGLGLDARWRDAAQTFAQTGDGHALTVGGDVGLHTAEGHGGVIAARWGTAVFGPGPTGRESLHVELRYAYRAAVSGTPLVLRVDVGVAGVWGRYRRSAFTVEEGFGIGAVVGGGATLVLAGPWILGLWIGYSALADVSALYGHGVEVLLRTGVALPGAMSLGS